MLNYHELMQWHKQHELFMQTEGDDTDGEASYDREYVTQKLNHGLNRIWKVNYSLVTYLSVSYRRNPRLFNYVSSPHIFGRLPLSMGY